MSTPTVTIDTSGNRVETYPDFVDASGFTVSKVVTTYTEIPYSTIAFSGISIGMAILWLVVNSVLIGIGYFLFGFGGKMGYVILGLFIICSLILNIYNLSTLNRVPKCTRTTRKNDTTANGSLSCDNTVVGTYFNYQWNVAQLLANLIFLGLIVPKVMVSAPTNSGNRNPFKNQPLEGGKRKGTHRRRT